MEHKVLKAIREENPPRGTWLVAVSGGVDSLVLAEILQRWRRALKITPIVAHVHHGLNENPLFRHQAKLAVREWCRTRKVKFISNTNLEKLDLSGEAEFRDFRYRALRKWKQDFSATQIVLAHHADDLLETRMLRLIRGVGPQGFRAMKVSREDLLRPLLSLTRAEIEAYAREEKLIWVEDPTNHETSHATRNWLRHEWLPNLEKRQRGALKVLARSLELLVPQQATNSPLTNYVGLRRKALAQLAMRERGQTIADYLRSLGLQSYGETHVKEILKRLENPERQFAFEILGWRFEVSPDLVWASRV